MGARPGNSPAAGRRGRTPGAPAARLLITVLLLIAAVLDLSRCGIVLSAAPRGQPAAGLVAAGLAAWAAVLIGIASAPQAAALGFRDVYAVPDTATVILGILLTVAVLATAGRAPPPGRDPRHPCRWSSESPGP